MGYPSGQDGAILPARDCPFCSRITFRRSRSGYTEVFFRKIFSVTAKGFSVISLSGSMELENDKTETGHHFLAFLQCSKRNKYEDHFFSVLHNESFIDQASSVKMAGYWPRSLFAFLWTSTSSRSINTQIEILADIQSSRPCACSIKYMYWH